VRAEVGFVQEDDRLRASFVDHDEKAFEAAEVKIVIQPLHDEDHVHVRAQHLFVGVAPGDFARDLRGAWQHGVNGGLVLGRVQGHGHPVAGLGQGGGRGLVEQFASDLGDQLGVGGEDVVEVPVLGRHPRRHQAGGAMRGEGGFPTGVPAELRERRVEIAGWRVHSQKLNPGSSRSSGPRGNPLPAPPR
jgi:hypothetical protein